MSGCGHSDVPVIEIVSGMNSNLFLTISKKKVFYMTFCEKLVHQSISAEQNRLQTGDVQNRKMAEVVETSGLSSVN